MKDYVGLDVSLAETAICVVESADNSPPPLPDGRSGAVRDPRPKDRKYPSDGLPLWFPEESPRP
jgi:hypothetical protein